MSEHAPGDSARGTVGVFPSSAARRPKEALTRAKERPTEAEGDRGGTQRQPH